MNNTPTVPFPSRGASLTFIIWFQRLSCFSAHSLALLIKVSFSMTQNSLSLCPTPSFPLACFLGFLLSCLITNFPHFW